MKIDLSIILQWLDIDAEHLGVEVSGLCADSRKVKSGDVFIALSGDNHHAIDFAYQAQRAGACAILAESITDDKAKPKARQQPLTIPVVEIDNLSAKLGSIASQFYACPAQKLAVIGITGTNGKTSCAWLLLQAWNMLGVKAGYIGTLGYGTIKQIHKLNNTTPCALQLQKLLAKFVNAKVKYIAMEVSSHGLTLGRVNCVNFAGTAFTNISHDHLDFHKTMENYAQAKKSLFTKYKSNFAIINQDDSYGKQWLADLPIASTSYSSKNSANLFATNIELLPQGINFTLHYQDRSYNVFTKLLGHFNVDNLLLVVATLLQQNFAIDEIIKLIPELNPVSGRMNRVEGGANTPLIIVDYAHTPDALKQVLTALQQHNARKIWCIFGCGGNRDKGKRPQMGHIAETLADYVIVTDDNPRYEENRHITDDILMGMNTKPMVINARQEAITYAITHAHQDDVILIAGKGHETYQIINGTKYPFDDRQIAAEILANLAEKCA
ncbi:MAG: UDP-N-acetylmuramoyl-L-alanyl-D-glutamate--2,6-diaminopimelate ligase [Proteobacteria bacterium]|nr:UDP-N-acetylmuramoyl-L-alanyl-D-glutamate--2,6-diaminopimelate ligase [Pseudomonadota bacterium]